MAEEQGGELAQRIRDCADRVGGGTELARRTGIARRTLEYYLSGAREPKASVLVLIADAAGVDVGWLASGRGSIGSTEDAMLPSEQFIRSAWRQVEIALETDGQKKALPWSGDTMVQMLKLGFEAALRVMEIVPASGHERVERASRLWVRRKVKEPAESD